MQLRRQFAARDGRLASNGPFQSVTPRFGRVKPPAARFPFGNMDGLPEEEEEEIISFITPDGIVRLQGSRRQGPRRAPPPAKPRQPFPTWDEQRICIGQSFTLAAHNGFDPSRRVHFSGFCHSVDLLHEVVEGVVSRKGGEILEQERQLKSGLSETLKLTVALPLLFGVPPQLEVLDDAIKSGGGIIDRVYKEWGMYRLPTRQTMYVARAPPPDGRLDRR